MFRMVARNDDIQPQIYRLPPLIQPMNELNRPNLFIAYAAPTIDSTPGPGELLRSPILLGSIVLRRWSIDHRHGR